ncbi:hypothetical protein JG687_00008717 [Phytophthora cactorum]|uniref:Concanavalin A-like lectin/glucanase domain n=1 Tax=Phytophthora cactorum TaxID=29920 RepID=A0A8T1UG47_9STRA|nr:hypothetical protein JG687_00008717 [Phytophthora cactorum]
MRLSKQGRSKKGIVAPMSDDEDSSGALNLHRSSYQPRQESKGVSFSTSRGKIWLILVVNLSIVTMFIFMSSTRFPSLSGEGIVNDALEQDKQQLAPVNKNAEQVVSLANANSAVTNEPQLQEPSRPGGYLKLMSTDIPEVQDKELALTDATESETTGDSYTGQKFFGNSPYGQFALHGGRPSFFANNGLVESAQELPTGQFSLVTYRLHQGYVEIKVNGGSWGGEAPVEGDERRIRVTVNDVVSLGNSKEACDTNAFQGRIAEVLVYNVVLDNAKIERVEEFLHDKWWGNRPFPKPAAPVATVADTEPVAAEVLHEDDLMTESAVETVSVVYKNEPQATQQASSTERPLDEENHQTSTTTEKHLTDNGGNDDLQKFSATEAEDVTPAPKFDPRVNIFEWTAPSNADAAKAARWRSTVKEKVNYIRNFQLGGDVLRTLIRQHKDELVALREELFG